MLPFKIGSLVSSTTTQPLTTVSNIQNIYAYFSINEKQEFDFLTWFEFAPEHETAFIELLGRLREREEWHYVEREVEVWVFRE